MSTVTLNPTAVGRPAINYWIVAGVVVVPTFMEILDTTIANVALRYIAGGLSAAQTDADWVITSYLAANAIVLPITGWLSAHLGRRNYFLLSIAIFTLASALCGLATSLGQMILFRIIQGLAGGGLQPCSQGVLLDAFPEEKQGTAMTLFGVAAIIAPIVGPTLGGWLCVDYNWRWIFLVNVPIGGFSLIAAYLVVDDPDYLKEERALVRTKPLNFDYIGLSVLVLVMSCWEIMLSKGQEWDWLGDPFGRVQTLVAVFVFGLGFLIFHEMRAANPIIDFRVLGERNFAIAASSCSSRSPSSMARASPCHRCCRSCSAMTRSGRG
jgi:DHA2 family multidrug resistance protein